MTFQSPLETSENRSLAVLYKKEKRVIENVGVAFALSNLPSVIGSC